MIPTNSRPLLQRAQSKPALTGGAKLLNKSTKALKTISLVLVVGLSLGGCVAALVAGATITTLDVIHDRRTVGEYIDDNAIEVTVRNILVSKPEYRKVAHVKPQSWNGILLLTGEIDSVDVKQEIIERAAAIQGVKQVFDETSVTSKTRLLARTNDAWITSKVKSRLLLKTGLDANRVKVVTTRGNVYLMGIVTREEANKAAELARVVKGVVRVIRIFEYKEDMKT